MEIFSDDEIILSIGDYLQYEKAQDLDSLFGKLIKLNFVNNQYEILSYGHRNPQGLYFDRNNQFLIETEHGPQGGDEINLINIYKVENFGWPVSSYGKHYDGKERNDAPLYKSHSKYGFKEPIYYFDYEVVGSHGISSIEKFFDNNLIIGTLNGRVFYTAQFNIDEQVLDNFNTFTVNERIRDFKFSQNKNVIYAIFEDSPSLGIIYNTLKP